jgi:hypothetical protein
MNRSEWALLLGLAMVSVAGCDQPSKPVAGENIEEAVAAMSAEATDETGECGAIAYLTEAMPMEKIVQGFQEIYRGCDSAISAQLSYAGDEGGSIGYSLIVLSAEQAGLEGDSWNELIDGNRVGMETVIKSQKMVREVYLSGGAGSEQDMRRIPEEITLPNGSKAMLFTESNDWVLLSLLNDRHALRIDISDMNWDGFTTEQAREQVAGLVSKVKLDRL